MNYEKIEFYQKNQPKIFHIFTLQATTLLNHHQLDTNRPITLEEIWFFTSFIVSSFYFFGVGGVGVYFLDIFRKKMLRASTWWAYIVS